MTKKSTKTVDWNEKSIPLGKRKVAYVKWVSKKLMQDGYSKEESLGKAKMMSNRKFGMARGLYHYG